MGLFYSTFSKSPLIGYADVGYLSDSYKTRSQIGYLFICSDIAVSWCFRNQTIVVTSSNYAEILALTESIRLRSLVQHIRQTFKLSSGKENLPMLYEDNIACIAQTKG